MGERLCGSKNRGWAAEAVSAGRADPDYLLVTGLYNGNARLTPFVADCRTKEIVRKFENTFYVVWSHQASVAYAAETEADVKSQQSRILIKACDIVSGEEKTILTAEGIIGDIKNSSDGKHVIIEIYKDYTVSYFYSYDERTGKITDITQGKAVQMKYADSIDGKHCFICKEKKSTGEILAIPDGEALDCAEVYLPAGKATLEDGFAIGGKLFVLMTEKVFLKYESFIENPVLLAFDGEGFEILEGKQDGQTSKIMVEQLWAASVGDGRKVPYFVVRRKDAEPDGNHPVWIYAYGGIYVLANIRGGAEFGSEWHEEGMKMQKKNCYYDFIGITEQLIADGGRDKSESRYPAVPTEDSLCQRS